MVELPLRKLEKYRGRKVIIRLKDNKELLGRLALSDPFMNVILENSKENKDDAPNIGDIFIRGNNVLWIKLN